MINVEAEVSRYKTCKDRDEFARLIKEYKNLALKSTNIVAAGQYNKIALRLQEICDKLPAQNLKIPGNNIQDVPVKTATITNEENARINTAWKQRTGTTRKSD